MVPFPEHSCLRVFFGVIFFFLSDGMRCCSCYSSMPWLYEDELTEESKIYTSLCIFWNLCLASHISRSSGQYDVIIPCFWHLWGSGLGIFTNCELAGGILVAFLCLEVTWVVLSSPEYSITLTNPVYLRYMNGKCFYIGILEPERSFPKQDKIFKESTLNIRSALTLCSIPHARVFGYALLF